MNIKNKIKVLGIATGLSAVMALGFSASEYFDMFGFDDKHQMGRTKNSITAIVGGLVAQKMYEGANTDIDMIVKKTFWPDGTLTGSASSVGVHTYVPVTFSSSEFDAFVNEEGNLVGEVEKSEFDWKVRQISENVYEIARFGLKFDAKLILNVNGGNISGTYVRIGPHFDWEITGTYSDNGNVNLNINVPLGLSVGLEGTVTKTE
ncbi:hypothetical protein COV11_03200 [Candidatus Woesearchaeota archaeon CG10_big_fil_rev_8_21_14_0_10_30_7]|nr:MAG: hypothetical protein COV11_03200 [Candidatus Woesearchaeota archaeon CG10_big_fil_rev_8_21_14_0_10_30_7]